MCGEDWFTFNPEGEPDIEKAYKVPKLLQITDYHHLARMAGFQNWYAKRIRPKWDAGIIDLITGYMYKLKYPSLTICYPFPVGDPDFHLIEAGKILEESNDFHLGLIFYRTHGINSLCSGHDR